jgi:acetylornithine/succinyldiaminopimelate/putrescine aminotransferase
VTGERFIFGASWQFLGRGPDRTASAQQPNLAVPRAATDETSVAVLTEALQGAGGVRAPPDGYLD